MKVTLEGIYPLPSMEAEVAGDGTGPSDPPLSKEVRSMQQRTGRGPVADPLGGYTSIGGYR